jgi:transcriptional regulator NrdR family protein
VMRTQLKVIKADGSIEEYSHTKVMGTINNALCRAGEADVYIAEQLAEVVTYFLYHRQNQRTATSSEIFSIIKAVLSAVGYEEAAIGLTEYHFERRLKRSRTEVVSIDIRKLADAEMLAGSETAGGRYRWDKSRIAEDLVEKYDLSTPTARTIASMVEEQVFNIGINLVPSSLIKQLVLGDTAAVLRAQKQLQTA